MNFLGNSILIKSIQYFANFLVNSSNLILTYYKTTIIIITSFLKEIFKKGGKFMLKLILKFVILLLQAIIFIIDMIEELSK